MWGGGAESGGQWGSSPAGVEGDRVEWEEAFELVSLKLSAHQASANGRTPSWLHQRPDIHSALFPCGVGVSPAALIPLMWFAIFRVTE